MRWSNTKPPPSVPRMHDRDRQPALQSRGWLNIERPAVGVRDGDRSHCPERVDVAVERVRLALRGPAARRALAVEEVRRARRARCPGGRSQVRRAARTGSWSCGTGTVPQASQWTIGIGAPQARWREIGKSRDAEARAGRVATLAAAPEPPAVQRAAAGAPPCCAKIAASVRSTAGIPSDGGRPEARVDRRRDEHGQRARDPGSEERTGSCRSTATSSSCGRRAASRRRRMSRELLAHAQRRRSSRSMLRVVRRDGDELGLLERVRRAA